MLAVLCLAALSLQDSAPARPVPIVDASLDATGATLVVTGANRGLACVDVATGEETARTVLSQSAVAPSAAAPSPGGGSVAILTRDHEVWLWCPGAEGNGAPRRVGTVPGESLTPVWAEPYGSFVEWSSTGERLLVGVGDRGALLLDSRGDEVARIEPLGGSWSHAPIAWSGDGSRFAVITGETVTVHDAADGRALDVDLALDARPESIALSGDGARLAVGDAVSRVSVVDLEKGERVWSERVVVILEADVSLIACVAFSPDDRLLALTTAPVVQGAVMDASSGDLVWGGNGTGGRMGERSVISWSRDGTEWAHAMASGVMPTVHRRSDGERVPRPREDPRYPTGLRGLTPLFAAGGSVLHRTRHAIACLRELVRSGSNLDVPAAMIAAVLLAILPLQESASDRPHESMVDAVLDSTGEVLVVTGRERTVTCVDVATGEERARTTLPERSAWPWSAAPAPGGDVVAILTFDHRVWLWRPDAKQDPDVGPRHVATVPGGGPRSKGGWPFGSFVEWSATGERLLVGVGGRGGILLDDGGGETRRLESLSGSFVRTPLAWSADGSRFASVVGGAVSVLEARTGEPIDLEVDLEAPATCVALSANGGRLVVGCESSWLASFDVDEGTRDWAVQFEYEDLLLGATMAHSIGDVAISPDGRLVALTCVPMAYGGLVDSGNGNKLWDGAYVGSRMQEPAAIEWRADSEEWAYAFVSGVMPLAHLRPNGDRISRERGEDEPAAPQRGFVPLFAAEGRVLYHTYGGVHCFANSQDAAAVWTYRM